MSSWALGILDLVAKILKINIMKKLEARFGPEYVLLLFEHEFVPKKVKNMKNY